jgi:hypothetical protein
MRFPLHLMIASAVANPGETTCLLALRSHHVNLYTTASDTDSPTAHHASPGQSRGSASHPRSLQLHQIENLTAHPAPTIYLSSG